MVYTRRAGYHIKVDPQVVGDALEKIREKNGGTLTPDAVVTASKPKAAPLHSEFEWDDSVAGHQWRINQARQIVRSVALVDEGVSEAPRAFVSVQGSDEEGRAYVSIEAAMSRDDWREQVLRDALAEALSWQRRYQSFKELAEIHGAIEATAKQLELQEVA